MLWIGKGDSTFVKQANLGGQDGTLIGSRPYVADFNGDRFTDILWVDETGGLIQRFVGAFGDGGRRVDQSTCGFAVPRIA